MALLSPESSPLSSLTAAFLGWKSFLLAVSLGAAIGPDYDTSTSLFFEHTYGPGAAVPALVARLTRWDALYFAYASREGYVYEQQWAFGAALPTIVQYALRSLRSLGLAVDDGGVVALEPLLAILFAHVTHFFAVLVLYRLTVVLFGDRRLAYVAAVLHVISPAGLFLSAPYSESPFAFLSFLGYLLFAWGIDGEDGSGSLRRDAGLVGAGVAFGLSTTFRSNGLFNGMLFAVEAFRCLMSFVRKPGFATLWAGVAPVVAGLCVAAGSVVPQAIAWTRYCHEGNPAEGALRPWCRRTLPSVYTYVQDVYWNNGFLKYWTPGQIPLFLLASPVLSILIKSSMAFLSRQQGPVPRLLGGRESFGVLVRAMSAVQLAVAVLAITNFHVQIITRISSGYPVWYWWVAFSLGDEKLRARGSAIVVFMVMYASVQGGLFASFLPPA